MKIKPGVRVFGLRPECILAALIVESIYVQHGSEAVLTSGIEGKHSRGSIHYMGGAFDIGIKNLQPDAVHVVHQKIVDSLGADFDVILEMEKLHIHIEFQPKEAYTS